MSLSRAVNDHSDEGASQTATCQFLFFFFCSNINLLMRELTPISLALLCVFDDPRRQREGTRPDTTRMIDWQRLR